MSHHAHGTQRSHGHATRIGDMDTTSTTTSSFFDELHPHLRNVTVGQQRVHERIHQYLTVRPERTASQVCEKFGLNIAEFHRHVKSRPELFVCNRGKWSALPAEPRQARPRTVSAPLAALIDEYLAAHGPSLVKEIAAGIASSGYNAKYIANVICHPPCHAVKAGMRGRYQLWGLPEYSEGHNGLP